MTWGENNISNFTVDIPRLKRTERDMQFYLDEQVDNVFDMARKCCGTDSYGYGTSLSP
jgi:hypothetical protein